MIAATRKSSGRSSRRAGRSPYLPHRNFSPYTVLINYLEAATAYELNKSWSSILQKTVLRLALKMAHREEKLLTRAAREVLAGMEELLCRGN